MRPCCLESELKNHIENAFENFMVYYSDYCDQNFGIQKNNTSQKFCI